ncbi:MAG: hypothetical protein GY757_12150 [bacterium]|nr:hypothetical protein [bacterium]
MTEKRIGTASQPHCPKGDQPKAMDKNNRIRLSIEKGKKLRSKDRAGSCNAVKGKKKNSKVSTTR